MAHEPDLHIRQDVPYMEAARGALSSKFCFVPRGKSAWSSRFFRVLFADCVPVLLNDFYEPPFGEIFDPSSFVVRWPMQRVGHELLETLRKVTPEAYEKILKDWMEAWPGAQPAMLVCVDTFRDGPRANRHSEGQAGWSLPSLEDSKCIYWGDETSSHSPEGFPLAKPWEGFPCT
ncbi:3-xylosyltransferase (Protein XYLOGALACTURONAN DEFICIENT 1) [Durusdinium trenchii]|uniref:3-xylosyltransferase (Protein XYLOGALACTURONAN DEFICIENT 1) n=1 Tax=Durusdinium trenchii TaxID=1381693 RepID=A0ABP0MS50_9DINO